MANENKMEFVILGLLSHEPLTGYEMKKKMDTTMSLFWSGSYGSIYPTLQKLKDHHLIDCQEVMENGRDKNIYAINDLGRLRLKNWLKEPVVKDELKYETLLKLFFGCEAEAGELMEHIAAFQNKMEACLPLLKRSVTVLKEEDHEPAHEYYMLTAMFGVKIYEASIDWCEMVKEHFEAKGKV